jgi:hypothetical protein
MNFKATRDELQRSNIEIDEKVVRVAGGGYVGVLSVYHELHCLVRFLTAKNQPLSLYLLVSRRHCGNRR